MTLQPLQPGENPYREPKVLTVWPLVDPDFDWCSEWTARQEPEESAGNHK